MDKKRGKKRVLKILVTICMMTACFAAVSAGVSAADVNLTGTVFTKLSGTPSNGDTVLLTRPYGNGVLAVDTDLDGKFVNSAKVVNGTIASDSELLELAYNNGVFSNGGKKLGYKKEFSVDFLQDKSFSVELSENASNTEWVFEGKKLKSKDIWTYKYKYISVWNIKTKEVSKYAYLNLNLALSTKVGTSGGDEIDFYKKQIASVNVEGTTTKMFDNDPVVPESEYVTNTDNNFVLKYSSNGTDWYDEAAASENGVLPTGTNEAESEEFTVKVALFHNGLGDRVSDIKDVKIIITENTSLKVKFNGTECDEKAGKISVTDENEKAIKTTSAGKSFYVKVAPEPGYYVSPVKLIAKDSAGNEISSKSVNISGEASVDTVTSEKLTCADGVDSYTVSAELKPITIKAEEKEILPSEAVKYRAGKLTPEYEVEPNLEAVKDKICFKYLAWSKELKISSYIIGSYLWKPLGFDAENYEFNLNDFEFENISENVRQYIASPLKTAVKLDPPHLFGAEESETVKFIYDDGVCTASAKYNIVKKDTTVHLKESCAKSFEYETTWENIRSALFDKVTSGDTEISGATVDLYRLENEEYIKIENLKEMPSQGTYSLKLKYNGSEDYKESESAEVEIKIERNPKYSLITISENENGEITVSPENAQQGEKFKVTIKPDENYYLKSVKVTAYDSSGAELTGKSETVGLSQISDPFKGISDREFTSAGGKDQGGVDRYVVSAEIEKIKVVTKDAEIYPSTAKKIREEAENSTKDTIYENVIESVEPDIELTKKNISFEYLAQKYDISLLDFISDDDLKDKLSRYSDLLSIKYDMWKPLDYEPEEVEEAELTLDNLLKLAGLSEEQIKGIKNVLTLAGVDENDINEKLGEAYDTYYPHKFGDSRTDSETVRILYKGKENSEVVSRTQSEVKIKYIETAMNLNSEANRYIYEITWKQLLSMIFKNVTVAEGEENPGLIVTEEPGDVYILENGVKVEPSACPDAGTHNITVRYDRTGDYGSCEASMEITIQKAKGVIAINSKSITYTGKEEDSELEVDTNVKTYATAVVGIDVKKNRFVSINLKNAFKDEYAYVYTRILELFKDKKAITVGDLLDGLKSITDDLSKLIEKYPQLKEILDEDLIFLIELIEKLPDTDLGTSIYLDRNPVDSGVYFAVAVTTDRNYTTDMHTAYLTISPVKENTLLEFKGNLPEEFLSAEIETKYKDCFGAKLKSAGEEISEANIKSLITGITADGEVFTSTDPVKSYPTEPGDYVETAYLGLDNYSCTPIVRKFTIKGYTSKIITEADKTVTYDGNPHEVKGVVYDETGETKLADLEPNYIGISDTIYSSKTPPTNAGVYRAVFEYDGDGKYQYSKKTVKLTIKRKKAATFTIGNITKNYKKSITLDEVKTASKGTGLTDADYSRIFSGIKCIGKTENAGKHKLKVSVPAGVKINYRKITVNKGYHTIKALALDENDIKLTPGTYIYTGKKIKPSFTVIHNGTTLERNKDYLVVYSNNRKVGTGKITIKGIGNYKGTIKTTFSIVKQ